MTGSLPIKWHGGKQYLAKRILALFPARENYLHFVETHFGGGAVLFEHEPDGKSEVANDINSELSNLWHVLKNESTYESFKRIVEATPFSQNEWNRSSTDYTASPPVWRAWAFFVRFRQSRQGLGKDFATLSRNRTRRSMNEQVSAWLSAVEGLPEAHERLKRVVVLNMDAVDCIQQQDSPHTLFYCDPPYRHATRTATEAYEHEMSDADHQRLLEALGKVKGHFLLSGYNNDMYDDYALGFKWHRTDIEIPNHASGAKTKEIKVESIWRNFI